MWLLSPYAGFANGTLPMALCQWQSPHTVGYCALLLHKHVFTKQLHSGVGSMATADPFTFLAWHSPQLTTSLSVPSGWER